MIALYAAEDSVVRRVSEAAAELGDVVVCRDWRAFERHAARAQCAVLVARWLGEQGLAAQLTRSAHTESVTPLVVVTTKDADNLRTIARLAVQEVLWLHEVDRHLVSAVHRAQAVSRLQHVAKVVTELPHLSGRIRRMLAHLCTAPPPLPSLSALASTLHCDRRTLWYQWNRSIRQVRPLHLHDLLAWLLLVHATARKAPRTGWAEVARELGVHEVTIARAAMRYLDLSLGNLERASPQAVLKRFEGTLLDALQPVEQVVSQLVGNYPKVL